MEFLAPPKEHFYGIEAIHETQFGELVQHDATKGILAGEPWHQQPRPGGTAKSFLRATEYRIGLSNPYSQHGFLFGGVEFCALQ